MKNYPKQTLEYRRPSDASGYRPAEEDAFFADETEARISEGRADALEGIVHLLIWIAEGTTLEQRGVRTTAPTSPPSRTSCA